MSKTKQEIEACTIPELEAYMDECRDSYPKKYLLELMAVRNQKIKQVELDHWCLTEEQYDAAIAKAEARAEVEREIEALDIAHAEADSADKSEIDNERKAAQKKLAEMPVLQKHKCLQEAQRQALVANRVVQTAQALAAPIGVKGTKTK